MGLFDEVAGAVKGAILQGTEGGAQGILNNVLGNSSLGGLSGVLGQLQSSGLGNLVSSWTGGGQGQPVERKVAPDQADLPGRDQVGLHLGQGFLVEGGAVRTGQREELDHLQRRFRRADAAFGEARVIRGDGGRCRGRCGPLGQGRSGCRAGGQ